MLQSIRQQNKATHINLIGNNSWHQDHLRNLFQHFGHQYQHRKKEASLWTWEIKAKLNNIYLLIYLLCFPSSALLIPLKPVLFVNGYGGEVGTEELVLGWNAKKMNKLGSHIFSFSDLSNRCWGSKSLKNHTLRKHLNSRRESSWRNGNRHYSYCSLLCDISEIRLLESFNFKIINKVLFIISVHSSTLEQMPFARNYSTVPNCQHSKLVPKKLDL